MACALTALALGCGGDKDSVMVQYGFQKLTPLQGGFSYEGWIVKEGEAPESVGKFQVMADGSTVPEMVQMSQQDIDSGATFVVSIEQADDPEPSSPAQTKVLAGELSPSGTSLDVSHPMAMGTSFDQARGTFMLATPTTDDDADNDQGLWWIDPEEQTGGGYNFKPGLDLPEAPPGWKYESWVDETESNGETLSLGKFEMPDTGDDDGAGMLAGANTPPEFPGQDFIEMPRDLTSGHKTAISLEPEPDPGTSRFNAKLLKKDVENRVFPAIQQAQNVASDSLPQGSLTIADR